MLNLILFYEWSIKLELSLRLIYNQDKQRQKFIIIEKKWLTNKLDNTVTYIWS